GTGNDLVRANQGRVAPGAGRDVIRFTKGGVVMYSHAKQPVFVDLRRGIAWGQGQDVLHGVVDAIGSKFGDTLWGNRQPNHLVGFWGNDALYGRGGDDFLVGFRGKDLAVGNQGRDDCLAELRVGCKKL
ncbi:MAG: hypothetical protein ABI586_09975, partial [Candidatus Nanopelagicales bacterium]